MIFRPGMLTREPFPCEIVRRISGSVMAEVYLAKLQNTQHPVVVKGVAGSAPESARRALKREAELLKKVRLEGIPEIYGYFEEREKSYYIMSYHAGISLEELSLKKRLEEKEVKQIVLSLCKTLAYLHGKGILYGDLKPSNVVYSKGKVILLDFGTAMEMKNMVQNICFQGTAGYAAPEWYHNGNKTITCQADIFSLGATIYRLLEGQKKNRWQPVLDKCCAPEPENRYRSMAEIYNDINKIKI